MLNRRIFDIYRHYLFIIFWAIFIRQSAIPRINQSRFPKVVAEGRDQGTVVFPDARWKFFLEADPLERARRRQKDLAECGIKVDLEELKAQIESRDASDRNRPVGPLAAAPDAIVIDTTLISPEQTVEAMVQRMGKGSNGRD